METEKIGEKIRKLLSETSLKTFLYGILIVGILIAVLFLSKENNKYGYTMTNSKDQTCYDADGNQISAPGKYCLDIAGAAKDYGLNLNDSSNTNTAIDYTNDPNNNLTLDMSQDLILTNLYLKQNGVTDPTDRGKILAKIITNYQDSAQGKVYTVKDLNLNRGEDINSIKSYKQDLYNAFSKYNTDLKNNKSTDVSTYLSINNNFINSLISIPATKSGSEYQLRTLNLISNLNAYISSIPDVYSDPVKYLALGGDNYLDTFNKTILKINSDMEIYFNKFGVK